MLKCSPHSLVCLPPHLGTRHHPNHLHDPVPAKKEVKWPKLAIGVESIASNAITTIRAITAEDGAAIAAIAEP